MIEVIDLGEIVDSRGNLHVFERFDDIPMDVKRFYILSNLNEEERGFHAHKALTQLAVCVAGSCTVTLDNGHERTDIKLQTPSKGLVIRSMIWREMSNFSKDCVLLVLADQHYDESDYIRNYDDFKSLVQKTGSQ